MSKRVLYLCAREHRIAGYDIVYNDIEPKYGCDLVCDCLDVDLSPFDVLVATPPCNYWSKANNRFREFSKVAQMTKHLLPALMVSFHRCGKPYLIENVVNENLTPKPLDFCFTWGNHIWYTNVFFAIPPRSCAVAQHKAQLSYGHRDNNVNVDIIIRCFLEAVCDG